MISQKPRMVSGMRPTGKLHLGHYHGVLKNWLKFQDDYESYFFVADWHSLTTEYADPKVIGPATRDILIDWLAAGIRPESATLFVQSKVPEHAELHLLLSMLTPVSWLERVPSYKELQQELSGKDLSTYGFLGYPLLQTADVAIYQASVVPVGQDQLAHLELSREVVRRFNFLYGETFIEPQSLVTEVPKLPGIDGRKMSKSYQNAIGLSEDVTEVEKKILTMKTDPARKRRSDVGNPDLCPVFDYHRLYTDDVEREKLASGCKTAGIGCIDCKKVLNAGLIPFLKDHQEKRREFEDPKTIEKIVGEGASRARKRAAETLETARKRMGL